MKRTLTWAVAAFLWLLIPGFGRPASYSQEEILAEVKRLAKKMELAPDKAFELTNKVKATLSDTSVLPEEVKNSPVNAVLIYSAVEAGLVVKHMNGKGLVSFEKGRKEAPIYLRSWSAGAMIGGSAQWGVGLVLDLKDEDDFGGEYKGETKNSTIADTTAQGGTLLANKRAQKIFMITIGRGFSAGIGNVKLTITPGW